MPDFFKSEQEKKETILHAKVVKGTLSDPGSWIKNSLVFGWGDGKFSYCVVGAISHKGAIYTSSRIRTFLATFLFHKGFIGITDWNDSEFTTHKTVMETLDGFIKWAESLDVRENVEINEKSLMSP